MLPYRARHKAKVEACLHKIAGTDRTLSRQLTEPLELIYQSKPESAALPIETAAAARAFGAGYVAGILHQQRSRRRPRRPLVLCDPLLDGFATDPLSVLECDAFALRPEQESDDSKRNRSWINRASPP